MPLGAFGLEVSISHCKNGLIKVSRAIASVFLHVLSLFKDSDSIVFKASSLIMLRQLYAGGGKCEESPASVIIRTWKM